LPDGIEHAILSLDCDAPNSDPRIVLFASALWTAGGLSLIPNRQAAFAKAMSLSKKATTLCKSDFHLSKIADYNFAVLHAYHHIDPHVGHRAIDMLNAVANRASEADTRTHSLVLRAEWMGANDSDIDPSLTLLQLAQLSYKHRNFAQAVSCYAQFFKHIWSGGKQPSWTQDLPLVDHLVRYADALLHESSPSMALSISSSLLSKDSNCFAAYAVFIDAMVELRMFARAHAETLRLKEKVSCGELDPVFKKELQEALAVRLALFDLMRKPLSAVREISLPANATSEVSIWNHTLLALARSQLGKAVMTFLPSRGIPLTADRLRREERRRALRETLRLPLPPVSRLTDEVVNRSHRDAVELFLLERWLDQGDNIFKAEANASSLDYDADELFS
jgi:hypothetical protein